MKKSAADNISVEAGVNYEKEFEDKYGAQNATAERFRDAAEEAVMNSLDADAGTIQLLFDKSGNRVEYRDDGKGFSPAGMSGWFFINRSVEKEKKASATGIHGTGRTKVVRMAVDMMANFRNEHFPLGCHALLSIDVLRKIYVERVEKGTWTPGLSIPWPLEGARGTVITVRFTEQNYKKLPSPEDLIETFADRFSLSVAEMIRISTDGKHWHRLKERALLYPPVRKEFSHEDLVRLVGKKHADNLKGAYLELFIPETRGKKDSKGILLGTARMGFCPIKRLLQELQDPLKTGLVSDSLRGGAIEGGLYIQGLREFRGEDSKSLRPDFFKGMDDSVLAFIDRCANEEADRLFQQHRNEREMQAHRDKLQELCRRVGTSVLSIRGPLGRGKPQGGNGRKPIDPSQVRITISPHNPEVVFGQQDSIEFTATVHGASVEELQWRMEVPEGTEPVGKFTTASGTKANVLIEALGACRIIAEAPMLPGIIGCTTLEVTEQLLLGITPVRATLQQGARHWYRATNAEKIPQERLVWNVQRKDAPDETVTEIRFTQRDRYRAELEVDTLCPIGTYLVRVWDKKHPAQVGVSTLIVKPPEGELLLLEIKDELYRMEPVTVGTRLVCLSQRTDFLRGSNRRIGIAQVQCNHPHFRAASKEDFGLMYVLYMNAVREHLQTEVSEGRIEEKDFAQCEAELEAVYFSRLIATEGPKKK